MFRWLTLIIFLASLAVSASFRWRARRTAGTIPRSAEAPRLIAARLIGALPLFGGVIAYVVAPDSIAWAALDLPAWARWAGSLLGALVVPSVSWVLSSLGTNVSETVLTKPAQRLVTIGPYRWVRHPLYSVGIALFVSLGMMSANGFILLGAVAAAIGIRTTIIPREEAHLEARFGDDYRQYRSATGALLPALRRYDATESD